MASSAWSDGGLSSTNVAERGAARERLEAERAAAGVEVEHPGARELASPRMLIHASRTRSAVGRTRASFGIASRRPPNSPATILIGGRGTSRTRGAQAKGA